MKRVKFTVSGHFLVNALREWPEIFRAVVSSARRGGGGGGGWGWWGVLGLKTDGGVPLAAENWTQKDRGKN